MFRDYLRVDPKHLSSLHWLGLIYFQSGQLDRAQETMAQALKIDPRFFDGLRIRGLALMQLKHYAPAIAAFEKALSLQAGHAEILVNYGAVLLELKRPTEALGLFDRALAKDSKNAVAWNNRGNAFVALERFPEAVNSYNRALALDPNLETARRNRFLVRLKLGKVNRIPDFAVREMFDAIAEQFDSMLVDDLGYRGHEQVRALAERVLERQTALRILDIGCGTGLAGERFKEMAAGGRLDGVDLAPRMLEEARRRAIYGDLILGDFEAVLTAPGAVAAYDLIVCADAINYLGDLALAFAGAANRLEPGGHFLFTCEAKEGAGWEFNAANRFSHSETYLRDEAARTGLIFLAHEPCTIRHEKTAPVAGFVVALQKPAARAQSIPVPAPALRQPGRFGHDCPP